MNFQRTEVSYVDDLFCLTKSPKPKGNALKGLIDYQRDCRYTLC